MTLKKIVFVLFAILIFFVPLVLWPFTSEVFEFNKMVLVYILTTLITGVWLSRCLVERRFVFRRTILDIPLLAFFGSQLISTVFSIDPLTSWLGYYSRFNGGLVSTICYSLLYWAWVSNLDAKETLNLLKVWLGSAALVAIYGVAEHFGIDKKIWVQDVQSRVFSTLGQPNWLAAWLVALIPLTWALAISNLKTQNSKLYLKSQKFWVYFGLSVLFFWTLVFTKSRSGILGFGVAALIFWIGYVWMNLKEFKKILVPFAVIVSSVLIVSLISGTQFTPSIGQILHSQSTISNQQSTITAGSTALETGGTESGTIRKIVWTGAVQVWLHYPIFGTGVETFAYSYYKFRPVAHNMTSEWDFIYNKAHNEFLNVAANTGTIGLLSYLILIGFTIFTFIQKLKISNLTAKGHEVSQISNKFTNSKIENSLEIGKLRDPGSWKLVIVALTAGYASLLATNFFGFSVVPTQLQFFLFPAIAIALADSVQRTENSKTKTNISQKVMITVFLIAMTYTLYAICRYWYADTLYAKGKAYNSVNQPDVATKYLTQAISVDSNQPLFHIEIANSYRSLALYFYQQKDTDNTKKFTDLTLSEANTAITQSPANVNLKRALFGIYITLSAINQNYLLNAQSTLIDAITLAPTDAKLYYNLGLVYARTGQLDLALTTLKKTVELKPDYKEARLAYAILLIDKKQNAEAKTQLEYILKYLDPNDSLTKQTLEGIR